MGVSERPNSMLDIVCVWGPGLQSNHRCTADKKICCIVSIGRAERRPWHPHVFDTPHNARFCGDCTSHPRSRIRSCSKFGRQFHRVTHNIAARVAKWDNGADRLVQVRPDRQTYALICGICCICSDVDVAAMSWHTAYRHALSRNEMRIIDGHVKSRA